MIVGGLIIIDSGKITIKIEPAFALIVNNDLSLFTIKIIIIHHKIYSIFRVGNHKEMIGIRVVSKNILATATDDYNVILCSDFRDYLIQKRDINVAVKLAGVCFRGNIHISFSIRSKLEHHPFQEFFTTCFPGNGVDPFR